MITLLHVIADLVLLVVVIIYDKRITELEETVEELKQRYLRLSRRQNRPPD